MSDLVRLGIATSIRLKVQLLVDPRVLEDVVVPSDTTGFNEPGEIREADIRYGPFRYSFVQPLRVHDAATWSLAC
ncbi:MAG TPA: hypothetical protein VFF07_16950 [Actinomycetota bacterium]|nr:hypothetical protein [Actinomycetota bacterium]